MLQLFSSDVVKIVCLILGAGLMAVEIIIPGFGLAGLSGLAMLGIGTACMWIQHGMLAGLITLLAALLLTVFEGALAIRSAANGRLSRSKLILNSETGKEAEEAGVSAGAKGNTLTVLNPVGFAEIEGKRMEVLSETGYIEKGVAVTVTVIQGKKIIVTR